MLTAIKTFFQQNISEAEGDNLQHRLQLATAALLIEMTFQDHEVNNEESEAVKRALEKKFDLAESEVDKLFELAHAEVKTAVDYHPFTRLIAEHFSREQKVKVIEYLWSVAYADNQLDSYEEHMVRRIADLIHVPHSEFIKAKHQAINNPL